MSQDFLSEYLLNGYNYKICLKVEKQQQQINKRCH